MVSIDVSPLTHDVLAHTMGGNPDDSVLFNLPDFIYSRIGKMNRLDFDGYLLQKAEEFVDLGFASEHLRRKTNQDVKIKLSYFTNDIINGIDAWVSVGNARRVGADVTTILGVPIKEERNRSHQIWEESASKKGKGIAGSLGDRVGRIVIGIPPEIRELTHTIVSQSESVQEAFELVQSTSERYQKAIERIQFRGLNNPGKRWVNRFFDER